MRVLKKSVSVLLILTMVISLFTVIPFEVSAADAVEYIYRSWDSESKTVVSSTQTCTNYKDLAQRGSNNLSGFYVVRSNMSVGDWLNVPDNGSASIILCDGATLTLSDGISVAESGSLTIYGQNRNTGKLYCHHENSNGALIGGYGNSGDITIHGGTLDLYTFYGAACIGGGEGGSPNIVTIYGGTIKCKGGSSACIGGGEGGEASHYNGEGVRIYGGTFDLTDSGGACIGSGWNHDGSRGSIAIYGGTITGSSGSGTVIGGGSKGQGPQIDIYGGNITGVTNAGQSGAAIGSGANAHQIAPINIHGGNIVAISQSGAGIGAGYDRSCRSINITGGTIVATSTSGGAGIGGGRNGSGENISISNAHVVATAENYDNSDEYVNMVTKMLTAFPSAGIDASAYFKGVLAFSAILASLWGEEYSGAGIGGGEGGGFNNITISNSTVNATAGGYAAGIGSGDEAENCGKITITNSTVTATGGSEGAGIGTGNDTDTTADITISYSKVEAYGGWLGAGIGGGDDTDGGNIKIEYSEVKAEGGQDAAGIGGGEDGDGGTIRITASNVSTRGSYEGAGIGGGEDGNGGNITIERSNVYACAGSDGKPVAVGKGNGGSSHGSLTLGDGVYVLHDDSRFEGSSAVSACRYYRSVSIRYSCNHNNKRYVSCDDTEHSIFCEDCGMYRGRVEHTEAARYVDETYHEVYCSRCGHVMGKEEHKLVQYGGAAREGGIECADCHEVFPSVYLAVLVDNSLRHFVYYPPGEPYTIPDCTDTFNGRKFACWKWANEADGDFYYPGQELVLDNSLQIDTVLVPVADTSYIDRDGASKTVGAGVLTASNFPGALTEGWYVVTESVDFSRQPFHIVGDVKLIVKDGVTVKINQEIIGSDGASLTIYGQSAQTGKFECTGDVTLSSYRQYGGSFSSSGTVSVSDDIEITRGSFTADLLSCEHAGTAKLLGGTIELNALSFNGTTMELGWSSSQDSITLGKYLTISNHCTFKISDGQAMKKYYTGGESYTGTLTADHIAQIEDVKLIPYEQHHFGAPQWSWSDDYSSASAIFVCTDHSEEFTVEAEVTKVETPTQRYFKAECWFNGAVYSNEQVRDILRAITVQQNAHGTVTTDKQTAAGGETVKLNAAPNSGWAFTTFTVTDASGNPITVTNNSFTMPTAAVTVSAEFINYTYVPAVEPYVGEDGAYVFGVKEHYKDSSGNKYLINADRSRGDLCQNDSDLTLSYFEVGGNVVYRYIGPTDNLTELVIPKTYNGTAIEALGNNWGPFVACVDGLPQFTLVLNENIKKIRKFAFYEVGVTTVAGDTSSLEEFETNAFWKVNPAGDYRLDITLQTTEWIYTSDWAFSGVNLTAHVNHGTAAEFLAENGRAASCVLDFMDEHLFSNDGWWAWLRPAPIWKWSDDYSSAIVTFTCADDACGYQETLDANVTKEVTGNKIKYTATVEFYGETFTDTKTVERTAYTVNISDTVNGSVTSDSGTAYAGDEVTLTVTPDEGYVLKSLTVKDADNNAITVTNSRFTMPASDVTVSATFSVPMVEPYIDEDGDYKLGTVEHYVIDGKNYAVNADGSIGRELSDISLSYFNFTLNGSIYQINYYTGPVENLTLLEIPKTFNGKKITILGSNDINNLRQVIDFGNEAERPIELKLTENIEEIAMGAFYNVLVTKISGDTARLRKIGLSAFYYDNSPAALDITLNRAGNISTDYYAFGNRNVTAHLKHAARFSTSNTGHISLTYDFTDAHVYESPSWTWSDDDSSATATFICSDDRCKHNGGTVDATVTKEEEPGKTTYTATAEFEGETYTDQKVVEKASYAITIAAAEHGAVSAPAESAYEGEEVTLTVTPDMGYKLQTLTVKTSSGEDIEVSDGKFIMPADDVTVTAVFEQKTYDITYTDTNGGWVRGAYSANYGEEISLEVIPADGYELDTLTVTDENDSAVEVSDNKFTMPDSGVTVAATFKKYDLSITYVVVDGQGTITGAATAQFNDEVPLTITPAEGYALFNLYAEYGEWDDPANIIDGALIMPDSNATVYAEFVPITSAREPWIDENGEYHLGNIEHCEIDGYYYEVVDGVVGNRLDSVALSYFDFELLTDNTYQINYYTGSYDGLDELVIPKSYNGKHITVLGTGIQGKNFMYEATGDKAQFKLVLNENIEEIKDFAFWAIWVTEVKGNTENLKKIGLYAFSWVNSRGGYTLDIKLDYPGTITVGSGIFNNMNVTARIRHATAFSSSKLYAKSIDYIFTDAHTYGDPTWTWSDDNSAATATFTCTDSRCRHQETVNATITRGDAVDGKVLLTASVEMNGTTYTDEKEIFADAIGARVVGHSISLNGDIGVNFYMELADHIANSDTAYMHFTIPTGTGSTEQDVLVKDARQVISGNKTYYVFKCQVAAKEMTSVIKAQIIYGENVGEEYTYSVKEYADYLLEHYAEKDEWTKAVPIVKAMLNYGAYSQIYFEKNPTALANAGLTDEEKELADVNISAAEPIVNLPDGVTFEGATLSLKSETSLSLYFTADSKPEFSCKNPTTGEDMTVETEQNGKYWVARIRGIPAKQIGDTFTLNVNGGSITYSPLNYIDNALNGGTTDEKLINVVKALYWYWKAADEYFPD